MAREMEWIKGWERPAVAAREAGMASSTVYDAIERGEVKAYELYGGTLVVSRADVERLAELNRGPGRPPANVER